MKRRFLRFILAAFLAAAAGAAVVVATPAVRTKVYFAVVRHWRSHWPYTRGKHFPKRARAWLPPLTPVWMQVEPRVRMLLHPDNMVSQSILETGAWEPETWRQLEPHLGAGATFVDVGANIGYFSLKAARAVGATGRVIAIEPNPDTVRLLEGNIRASAVRTISVFPAACGASEGEADFFAALEPYNWQSSLSSENAARGRAAARSYRVRVRTLDAILREAGVSRVDALKVDVEGAELLVLKGAEETLARYRPALVIEVTEPRLQAMGATSGDLHGLLRARGYVLSRAAGLHHEFLPTAPAPR